MQILQQLKKKSAKAKKFLQTLTSINIKIDTKQPIRSYVVHSCNNSFKKYLLKGKCLWCRKEIITLVQQNHASIHLFVYIDVNILCNKQIVQAKLFGIKNIAKICSNCNANKFTQDTLNLIKNLKPCTIQSTKKCQIKCLLGHTYIKTNNTLSFFAITKILNIKLTMNKDVKNDKTTQLLTLIKDQYQLWLQCCDLESREYSNSLYKLQKNKQTNKLAEQVLSLLTELQFQNKKAYEKFVQTPRIKQFVISYKFYENIKEKQKQ